MKPAKLVDVATSGAVVTKYLATASSRERLVTIRPKPSCVEMGLLGERVSTRSGTAIDK